MELGAPRNGSQDPEQDTNSNKTHDPHLFSEEVDSTCSTPYVSAPSSPGRSRGPVNGGFFYSAPASPMHFAMTSVCLSTPNQSPSFDKSVPHGYEFEFSARFGSTGTGIQGSMSSADELFLDGKIRPMKLSTHLERPQVLAPLPDLDDEDEDENERRVAEKSSRGRDLRLRDKSLRRRTRSLSPLRNTIAYHWTEDDKQREKEDDKNDDGKHEEVQSEETTPSVSGSSSRSSSAGRSSKRWVFLKDFLYRSKSEGRSSNSKFWSTISFSPAKEKKHLNPIGPGVVQDSVSKEKLNSSTSTASGLLGSENQKGKVLGRNKPVNGIRKRRIPPSPHELHYTANRALAEELRKKTYLPYRQGLLGCLGFSSKGYGAMTGFTRALNPVSSR